VRQGDPFAAFAFALSVQPLYEAAIAGLPDCHAVSVQDDLTLMGPAEQVFAAFNRIAAAAPGYHLSLRVDKCAVYVPDSLSDERSRAEVLDGCATRQLAHSASLELLGVLLGSNDAVRAHCDKQVSELEERFRVLCHPAMPVQDANLLLSSCALPSLAFLTRTTPPELLRDSARRFDQLVRDTFLRIMQLDLERISRSGVATADELRAQISLPLKLGGMGLRPAERIAASAYFASAAAIVPDFLRTFPALAADGSATELFQQLQECRALMESQGINEAPTSVPIAKARRGSTPGAFALKVAAKAYHIRRRQQDGLFPAGRPRAAQCHRADRGRRTARAACFIHRAAAHPPRRQRESALQRLSHRAADAVLLPQSSPRSTPRPAPWAGAPTTSSRHSHPHRTRRSCTSSHSASTCLHWCLRRSDTAVTSSTPPVP